MPLTIQIKVTKAHIKRGKVGDKRNCPVAEAMKSAGLSNVSVDDVDVQFDTKRGTTVTYCTVPKAVSNFIERFDEDDTRPKCKPFTFRLTL